jgi:hypothetical protein
MRVLFFVIPSAPYRSMSFAVMPPDSRSNGGRALRRLIPGRCTGADLSEKVYCKCEALSIETLPRGLLMCDPGINGPTGAGIGKKARGQGQMAATTGSSS